MNILCPAKSSLGVTRILGREEKERERDAGKGKRRSASLLYGKTGKNFRVKGTGHFSSVKMERDERVPFTRSYSYSTINRRIISLSLVYEQHICKIADMHEPKRNFTRQKNSNSKQINTYSYT